MANIKKATNNKCWRGCEEKGTPFHCWWEYRLEKSAISAISAATVEKRMEFPQKTKNGTAFWATNSTATIILKKHETPIQKILCIPMFIAAQFTIAKCWKQPKCPWVNEWIKNYGTFNAHGLEELTSSKWPYYPKQFVDSVQSLLKYPWYISKI